MKTLITTFEYFLVMTAVQNLVLTTGFGSSMMLRQLRRAERRRSFFFLLLGFTVLTTAVCHPLEALLPHDWVGRLLRPLVVVAVAGLLYVLTVLTGERFLPEVYRRVKNYLPLAVFNNVVIGITLLINYQVSMSFFPAIGFAAGSAVGFYILLLLTADVTEQLDNPDTPAAFRGLPGTLVYLGLLALALMGFQPVINLL